MATNLMSRSQDVAEEAAINLGKFQLKNKIQLSINLLI